LLKVRVPEQADGRGSKRRDGDGEQDRIVLDAAGPVARPARKQPSLAAMRTSA
jgi:hypothetical protein